MKIDMRFQRNGGVQITMTPENPEEEDGLINLQEVAITNRELSRESVLLGKHLWTYKKVMGA